MSLPPLDAPGQHAADRLDGHLGSAPDLVALHEPVATPDLVPRQVLQRTAPESSVARGRRRLRNGAAALALHGSFAALFLLLLAPRPEAPDRDDPPPIRGELVDVDPVVKPAPRPETPKEEPRKPNPTLAGLIRQPAPPPPPVAPAPDPHPPAPPALQPPPPAEAAPAAQAPPPAQTPPAGDPTAAKLVAPPPEPRRAKTQAEKSETPNDVADDPADAHAKREAKPVEAQTVLATANPKAAFAVPKPDATKPTSAPPAPAAPRQPSETEKLAAILPTDTSALPDSFRAVLSGNGAAVDAAYKGLVYGRFSHAAEIGERARRMHLRGQVIVAFTIGDDGALTSLAVLQSSGNPSVDALGLEMIRSAAPFPPPPPGAQHSFTPALAFGD